MESLGRTPIEDAICERGWTHTEFAIRLGLPRVQQINAWITGYTGGHRRPFRVDGSLSEMARDCCDVLDMTPVELFGSECPEMPVGAPDIETVEPRTQIGEALECLALVGGTRSLHVERIWLKYVEEWTHEEIGAHQGVSHQAVSGCIDRCLCLVWRS